MRDQWLIFALYCYYEEQDYFTADAIYEGNFPTRMLAEEFMKGKTFGRLVGITGIIQVMNNHGWV